jgi:hypothetical protein
MTWRIPEMRGFFLVILEKGYYLSALFCSKTHTSKPNLYEENSSFLFSICLL